MLVCLSKHYLFGAIYVFFIVCDVLRFCFANVIHSLIEG